MTSTKQTKTNRHGVRRGTGPGAPAGEAAASPNAGKQDQRAHEAVMPGEVPHDFASLLAEFEQEFRPATACERSLVRQVADADWRLRRVSLLESSLLIERLDRSRSATATSSRPQPDDPLIAESSLARRSLPTAEADVDALSKLSRYEARLRRQYFRAIKYLHETRAGAPPSALTGPEWLKKQKHDQANALSDGEK